MEHRKGFIPYRLPEASDEELLWRAAAQRQELSGRRSVRHFSDRPVPREVIAELIATASSAPSGANKQPWTFCAVSNPEVKRRIREAAEIEERQNYDGSMSAEWLADQEVF